MLFMASVFGEFLKKIILSNITSIFQYSLKNQIATYQMYFIFKLKIKLFQLFLHLINNRLQKTRCIYVVFEPRTNRLKSD